MIFLTALYTQATSCFVWSLHITTVEQFRNHFLLKQNLMLRFQYII